MVESRSTEFKESVTNTFLKTVSAYANYGTGTVLFGITDNGTEVGIPDAKEQCLAIENKINDAISPTPDFVLETNPRTRVITLTVREGLHKPYLYRSKAYKRACHLPCSCHPSSEARISLNWGDTKTVGDTRPRPLQFLADEKEAVFNGQQGV